MKTGNWMTHLEYDLESPIWRHLYRELTKSHTLIRYDARGNGLSDRTVDEISFESSVGDLETVVEAAKLDRFALLGISQGCAFSIAFAFATKILSYTQGLEHHPGRCSSAVDLKAESA